MAGFKGRRGILFSPREIIARQIGPNTVRYEAKKQILEEDEGTEARVVRGTQSFVDRIVPFRSLTRKEKKEQRRQERLEERAIAPKKDKYWNYYKTGNNRVGFNRERDDDEDYYAESYIKPAWEWSPTRWSSFTFSTFVNSDDNTKLFVKDPESYMTPTVEEIKSKSNYWEAEDMKRIKELARVCYLKMLDDRDYIDDKYKDMYQQSTYSEEQYNKLKTMFDSVYDTFIPGVTPLEQAIAVNHKVRDAYAKKVGATHTKSMRGESSRFEFLRSDYADPYLNKQVEMNELSKERKLDILNRISIIGDMGSQFMVTKEVGEREVANSDLHKMKVMKSHEQIINVDLYQRIIPNFKQKFYTKNLMVRVPVKTDERKQKIIIILDFSGSMDEREKQIWVNAILIDRFRYVMKGEAEVYFSYFVHNPEDLHFTHIKNEEDVKNFWRSFSNRPSGSYTNMKRVVEHIAREVKNGGQTGKFHNLDIDLSKEKPEILIVNDGQDAVNSSAFPYKVNAVSLMQFSNELKNLCIKSGGKQVQIMSNGNIFAYSSEGMETIYDKYAQ